MKILSGLFSVLTLLASICYFTGIFSWEDKSIGTTIVTLLVISLCLFISSLFRKEIGRLDKNGFHLEGYSIMGRSTQDIPLDSILEFRSGMQEEESDVVVDDDITPISTTSYFVEIVTSGKPFHILEGGSDGNNRREWLINSGNALLKKLKGEALETQSNNEEKLSDESMGVEDFNDDIE